MSNTRARTPQQRLERECFMRTHGVMVGTLKAYSLRLLSARLALGLTQAQLAERVSVSVETVSRWENGHKMPGWTSAFLLESLTGLPCTRFRDDNPLTFDEITALPTTRKELPC